MNIRKLYNKASWNNSYWVYIIIFLLLCFIVWNCIKMNIQAAAVQKVIDILSYNNEATHKMLLNDPENSLYFNVHTANYNNLSLWIAISGIILTFAAFYIQYAFNKRQKNDLSNERFENQYFNFLDIYRNISNSTEVPKVGKGKIAFHYMFYEYKALYAMIKESNIISNNDPNAINKLAFTIFFDGVSKDFDIRITDKDISLDELSTFHDRLLALQEMSEKHNHGNIIDSGVKYIRDYKEQNIKYFDGHRLRLTHYFKFIIVMIDHINKLETEIISSSLDPINYLYASLSEHEIGLLYAYVNYLDIDKVKIVHKKYFDRIFVDSQLDYRFKYDEDRFVG